MEGEITIKIVDQGYKLSREIYILRRTSNKLEILRDNTYYPTNPGGTTEKPTLELMPEELQALADALGINGFKPQKGFLEGKIEATEKHLEDMRKLFFKERNTNL